MFINYYRVLFRWVISFENLDSTTGIMSTLISVTMFWSVITAYWVQIIWQVFWWMYTNVISLWNDFPFLCNAIITKVFSHVGLSKHCRPEEQFDQGLHYLSFCLYQMEAFLYRRTNWVTLRHNLSLGFLFRSNRKPTVQQRKMVIGLNFWI